MTILRIREQLNESTALAKELFRGISDNEIHRRFVQRSHDDTFSRIGSRRLGEKKSKRLSVEAPHLLVWAGYEVAVGGPHTKEVERKDGK